MHNSKSRTMVSYEDQSRELVSITYGFELKGAQRHDRAVISSIITNGAIRLEYEHIYREAKRFFDINDSFLRSTFNPATFLDIQPSMRLAECIEKGKFHPDSPTWENLNGTQQDIIDEIMDACNSTDIVEEGGGKDKEEPDTVADKSVILEQVGE